MNDSIGTNNKKAYPQWHNSFSGGVAGLGSRMLTAPLDFVRIRRQLNIANDSLWQSLKEVYKTEGGLAALYRGNLAAISLWIGYASIQFSVYHRVKGILPPKYAQQSAFVSGATAGVCALLATYPLDVCRTSLVADGILSRQFPISSLCDPLPTDPHAMKKGPNTMISFAKHLYSTKGIRGFYAGVGPAVVQIIPYMGMNFTIYDYLTTMADDQSAVGVAAYAGSISGAVSKTIVYPLDTVKRRLQAQAFYESAIHYDSMVDCVKRVARDEGMTGFYRGLVPSVLKTAVATSAAFSLYRGSKNVMESIHDRNRQPVI